MERQPYDVRASLLVRRIVLLSHKDGQLEHLKREYEQLRRYQLGTKSNGLKMIGQKYFRGEVNDSNLNQFDEEICPLAKRRRIQNVKERLRAALRLRWSSADDD